MKCTGLPQIYLRQPRLSFERGLWLSMEKLPPISARMMSAVSFVRPGAVVCDVGTDHGYVPIYLVGSGRAVRAVASDVNEGPLKRADANIRRYGMSDRIKTVLTDGLDGLESTGATDILICGMGGELIGEIVRRSEFAKRCRLILQPMTFHARLREELLAAGYNILGEKLSLDAGKVYTCICAEFGGKKRAYTEVELLLGRENLCAGDDLLALYGEKVLSALRKKAAGLSSAGKDASKENDLIREAEAALFAASHGEYQVKEKEK